MRHVQSVGAKKKREKVNVNKHDVQQVIAKKKREKVNVNKHDVQQVIADVHQTQMYRYSLSLHVRISGMGLWQRYAKTRTDAVPSGCGNRNGIDVSIISSV
jgi:hypothetical protein